MVHIQGKSQVKTDLEALKLLGKIIAISKQEDSLVVIYEDGSCRIANKDTIKYVWWQERNRIIDNDPWLRLQWDLFNNILVMSDVEQFCCQQDNYYRAKDMTFHNKFNIYFPFSDDWEVEIEVI